METSAKTGFNVEELFCSAAKILYEESIKRTEVNKVNIYLIVNLII
jgi:SHS2 domain-containing protein